jgi:hypothetical protein
LKPDPVETVGNVAFGQEDRAVSTVGMHNVREGALERAAELHDLPEGQR